MTKFTVAVAGGGLAGLCLAAELAKQENIKVDVYEASKEFDELGAGLTLWGRVCEALYLMDLADDCIKASVVSATTHGLSKGSSGFHMRDFKNPDQDWGVLPMYNAWSMHRKDLLKILLRRVPQSITHLNKKLTSYVENTHTGNITIKFADGTCATCDVLVGCDGIRSNTRAQMMRNEVERSGDQGYARYIAPRWSGTTAYRFLIPSASLAARNPNHRLLSGGQVYFGKSMHIVGYPISKTMLNGAVSLTDLSQENTPWRGQSWSADLNPEATAKRIRPSLTGWHSEARDIVETLGSTIEWGIFDLEPLPFYAKGRVALMGDAAHAALPYIGSAAAHALEDAFVLSRILSADVTTRESLPLALEAYQDIRRPYGNGHLLAVREALKAFQFNGPEGNDMSRAQKTICRLFEECAGIGRSGPEADANNAIAWLKKQLSQRN